MASLTCEEWVAKAKEVPSNTLEGAALDDQAQTKILYADLGNPAHTKNLYKFFGVDGDDKADEQMELLAFVNMYRSTYKIKQPPQGNGEKRLRFVRLLLDLFKSSSANN